MNRRWTLLGLAIVAVIAIAVPAIAGSGSGKSARLLDVSRLASASRVKAHHALGVAKKARKKANRALRLAQKTAPTAGQPAFAQAPGTEATSETTSYVSLPGGPSVTVNVPQAANAPGGIGLIQVAAQTFIADDAGAVALFQDGAPIPGMSDVCDQVAGTPGPALFTSTDGLSGTWSTPASIVFTGNCGSTGPAAPVLFVTTPGNHTYELRYAFCGCSGSDATFSQRKLWVTPIG
jgi:hypothetical protein